MKLLGQERNREKSCDDGGSTDPARGLADMPEKASDPPHWSRAQGRVCANMWIVQRNVKYVSGKSKTRSAGANLFYYYISSLTRFSISLPFYHLLCQDEFRHRAWCASILGSNLKCSEMHAITITYVHTEREREGGRGREREREGEGEREREREREKGTSLATTRSLNIDYSHTFF